MINCKVCLVHTLLFVSGELIMLEQILTQGFEDMKISASDAAAERFRIYFEELEEKNKVMNLTAISGEEDCARLHFLDSISPLPKTHDETSARNISRKGISNIFPTAYAHNAFSVL